MPGMGTHIEIAERILKLLPEGTIKNKELFYLGSVAPDCIHKKIGYTREDKKHSHMRDDIKDMEFHKKENITVFHNRIVDFIKENICEENPESDLYRGYVVHLLTDALFLLKIRPDFVKEMDSIGVKPTDIMFRDKVFYELDCHDYMLIDANKNIEKICRGFKELPPCSVKGYIEEDEMSRGHDWIIERYFKDENKVPIPKYISFEKINGFIDDSAKDIIDRLSKGETFPKIL